MVSISLRQVIYEWTKVKTVYVLQTLAFQKMMDKFGVEQVIRTGKIALKRGENTLKMGGWGDSLITRGIQSADGSAQEQAQTTRCVNKDSKNHCVLDVQSNVFSCS